MSKSASNKGTITDLSRFCKSTFTLTFAVELLGIDVWHDCNEGWLDLGPCVQGMKIQYQLYPGQSYDVDVLIWPHTAKVWCGSQYGWVRTWQFLERRWLTFSIRHAFPVRVVDLRSHVATVIPTLGLGVLGSNAKSDKISGVFLPPLKFGERRYFGPVLEAEVSLVKVIQDMIWDTVVDYIPASYLDGLFDVPHPVSDIRHQDTVIEFVQETILNQYLPEEIDEPSPEPEEVRPRDRRESKMPKEKEKKKPVEVAKAKFEIKLPGDTILAGAGRIISFEAIGDRPPELGEVIVLISSNSLPAIDDQPIVFVNVENLRDIPVADFKKLRISQLYTRWNLGDEEHDSLPQLIKSKNQIAFNDHHTLPLPYDSASEICTTFLDDPYEIQLRGIRLLQIPIGVPKFFGYEKGDRDFGTAAPPKPPNEDLDILIAVTKIDAKTLARGTNGLIRAEYPMYPPKVTVASMNRESVCTNDINAVKTVIKPNLVVAPSVILQAQMSLEVSIGLVGCRSRGLTPCFSRLYSLISDSDAIMAILRQIGEINEGILETGERDNMLTGFALDTGDVVLLYVEGPRDGQILRVWEMTENFYPKVKPVFSSSARYPRRIYPELLLATMQPFNVLKMFVPLGALLACPPVYARPALPLPTRSAVLKIGRLVASKLFNAPSHSEMPTTAELKSFRLELCVAPRPIPVTIADNNLIKTVANTREQPRTSVQSVCRINWDK